MATEHEVNALRALEAAPWFGEGLRFTCTGCGVCCTGSAGVVYVSEADIERLCGVLKLSREGFVGRYTRLVGGRLALVDKPDSGGECVFLSGKACGVYEGRPVQCQTYPFWLVNVLDPDDWAETAEACEGIDHPEAGLMPAHEVIEACRAELLGIPT